MEDQIAAQLRELASRIENKQTTLLSYDVHIDTMIVGVSGLNAKLVPTGRRTINLEIADR